MFSMFHKARIAKLKRKARIAYRNYFAASGNLSCGLSLAEHVSTDVLAAKLEFNACMDALAKLDPSVPTKRL